MNHPWAICIAAEDAGSLALLRHVPGVEVAGVGAVVWLRGKACDESISARLPAIPARGRYEWMSFDRLRQLGHRIPSERLPGASWQPLHEWLRVGLPAAALPAGLPATHPLRLVRSTSERDPDLLLTTLEEFGRFAAEAARPRLDRMRFAASPDGRVLVQGTPLPPLPGKRFVLHEGIAVPAGFAWRPAVTAEVVLRRLGISGGAIVLWNEDDTLIRLHTEQWIPVTRAALRATAEAMAGHG